MMLPRARLLWTTAAFALPAAALAAVDARLEPVSWGLVLALVAMAALDAWLGRRALHGVTVELPPVVRMGKDRGQEVTLRIRDLRGRGLRMSFAIPLPPEIAAEPDVLIVQMPAGVNAATAKWRWTPNRRGSYRAAECYAETDSPWRLWGVRARLDATSEIRVYPDLLREYRRLTALMKQGAGARAVRQLGKGREFEKLREYLPGDSFDEIHWKATARRGRPVTKVFQIERTQEVYVVVDASRLSATPAGGDGSPVLEQYISAALILGATAQREGDLFGLAAFTDSVDRFVRAGGGRQHYGACRDAIFALQPDPVAPDFEELATFLRLRLRRRAMLVFFTELDDPAAAESFERVVGLLSRQHLVIVVALRPAGVRPLFTSGAPASVDGIYSELAGHIAWRRTRELAKRLEREGVRFVAADSGALAATAVSEYLTAKRRQAL